MDLCVICAASGPHATKQTINVLTGPERGKWFQEFSVRSTSIAFIFKRIMTKGLCAYVCESSLLPVFPISPLYPFIRFVFFFVRTMQAWRPTVWQSFSTV